MHSGDFLVYVLTESESILHHVRRLDGLRIMMEFPKPKDDEEQVAENITERKQVSRVFADLIRTPCCAEDVHQTCIGIAPNALAAPEVLCTCTAAGADSRKGV